MATTRAERLAALYTQRDDLIARIAAAGATPRQVSVVGSVAYEERSIVELQQALETIESTIVSEESSGGLVRVLPRYSLTGRA